MVLEPFCGGCFPALTGMAREIWKAGSKMPSGVIGIRKDHPPRSDHSCPGPSRSKAT